MSGQRWHHAMGAEPSRAQTRESAHEPQRAFWPTLCVLMWQQGLLHALFACVDRLQVAEKLGQRAHHQDEHHQQGGGNGKLQVVRLQVLHKVSACCCANSLQHTTGIGNTAKDGAIASVASCSSRFCSCSGTNSRQHASKAAPRAMMLHGRLCSVSIQVLQQRRAPAAVQLHSQCCGATGRRTKRQRLSWLQHHGIPGPCCASAQRSRSGHGVAHTWKHSRVTTIFQLA